MFKTHGTHIALPLRLGDIYRGADAGFFADPMNLQKYFTTYNGSTNAVNAGDMLGRWARDAGSFDWQQSVDANRLELARHPFGGLTQLFTYSDDFSNAVWVPVNATKSGRTFTVTGGSPTATHPAYQTYSVVAGYSYTYSIDVETTDYQYLAIGLNSPTAFGNNLLCYFRLTDATVFVKPAYYTTATITQVSANRWRIRCTGPAIASASTTGIRVYPAISPDGGTTATVIFDGNTYPGNYTLYKAHFQLGTSETDYQESTTANDITQDGQPSVWMPRAAGSAFFDSGVQALGSNTNGLFADTGYNWHLVEIYRTLADGTFTAQCGTTAANQMFRSYVASNTHRTRIRGTENNSGVTVTDGRLHIVHTNCANGVITCSVDGAARVTLTNGAAAAEAQNITFGAVNAAAAAAWLTGRGLGFTSARSWSVAEEQYANAWARRALGVPV